MALQRLGHRVECSVFYNKDAPDWAGLDGLLSQRIRIGKLWSPLNVLWKGWRTLQGSTAEVVIYEPSFWPLALLAMLGRRRKRMILDIRSEPVDVEQGLKGRARWWRYRLAIRMAKYFKCGMTVITPALRESVCSEFGLDQDRVGIWSSGVNPCQFVPARIPGAVSDDNFDLCAAYHGVLSPSRGLEHVVDAVGLLKQRGRRVRFLLIGDGPAREDLRGRAERLGVSDLLSFTGRVAADKVPALIDQCDIGVIPLPDYRGWRVSSPLKLMEYCAMGRPVVVTRIHAHEAVLSQSAGALYVESPSADAIASAMELAVRQRNLLGEWGRENRRIVLDEYTWEAQAKRLASYVNRIVSQNAI